MLRFLRWFSGFTLIVIVAGGITAAYLISYYEKQLPAVDNLLDTELGLSLRVYTKDDELISEFGKYKRRPLTYPDIPERMVHAFIAIEDARYYEHNGVDFRGIARAAVSIAKKRSITQGASTITMQVARNFFLSSERSFSRKIKEALLALKIDKQLSKEQVLELYLNKIYLGKRAYGVGAAAEVYYGKQVDELSLAEQAMIAGLPKAPSKFNPLRNAKRAKIRRDYILQRMAELGYISEDEMASAQADPITAKENSLAKAQQKVDAPYIAEMARHYAQQLFPGEDIYSKGLNIYTTLDADKQAYAVKAVQEHLIGYSKRHGYRGPLQTLSIETMKDSDAIDEELRKYPEYAGIMAAVVTKVSDKKASLYSHGSDEIVELDYNAVRWARPYVNENTMKRRPRTVSDVLSVGDIVRVRKDHNNNRWQFLQIPKAQAALVSLNPIDGALNTVVGGFDFHYSKFNRATQAKRQPGSGFKPFVYAAALSKGFSPSYTLPDEPIEVEGNSTWEPKNYDNKLHGLVSLRAALTKSLNLVSIRVLQQVGLGYAINYASKFGFPKETMPRDLTLALGTASVTPLQMATAYAVFANGGYRVQPYFIRKITDRHGKVLYQAAPQVACYQCTTGVEVSVDANTNYAPRVMKPYVNFQIRSMMRDVVNKGTGVRVSRAFGRNDVAGKTGTTNEQRDAWFNGFVAGKVVTTVWMGFDDFKPLGKHEASTRAAVPLWISYMRKPLPKIARQALTVPESVKVMKVDSVLGMPSELVPLPQRSRVMVDEYFADEQVPQREKVVQYIQENREAISRHHFENSTSVHGGSRQLERLLNEARQRAANDRRRAVVIGRENARVQGVSFDEPSFLQTYDEMAPNPEDKVYREYNMRQMQNNGANAQTHAGDGSTSSMQEPIQSGEFPQTQSIPAGNQQLTPSEQQWAGDDFQVPAELIQ